MLLGTINLFVGSTTRNIPESAIFAEEWNPGITRIYLKLIVLRILKTLYELPSDV